MAENTAMASYRRQVTLDDVRAARPEMIYYGANTCWWTHRPADLYKHPEAGLPCDPRRGMLLQTDDVDGFLRNAAENAAHYGKHGLRAFEAAHHGNVLVVRNHFPTCFRSWSAYNDLIDRANAEGVGDDA